MKLAPAFVAALGLAVLASAVPAQAAMMTYANVGDLTLNGIKYSNITETNNLTTGYLYGQPTITPEGNLWFNHPNNFSSESSFSTGHTTSGYLTFHVDLRTALTPTVLLSEWGIFTQLNLTPQLSGGVGKVSGILTLSTNSDTILMSVPLAVTPNGVFATDVPHWTATSGASGNTALTSFNVSLENDLQTIAAPTGDAYIEKKDILLAIVNPGGSPNVPEPASLGLLALGGLGLVTRGRGRRA